MAQTTLNDGMLASVFRAALNAMFGELYPKTAQTAPTNNVYPSLMIGSTANGRILFRSKTPAVGAGAVTIQVVANSTDNLEASITGDAITIKLANTTTSKNTALLVQTLLNSTPEIYAKGCTLLYLGDTGAGTFGATEIALGVQALSGGILGTVGYPGQVIYDTTRRKWTCAIDAYGGYLWIPSAKAALNTPVPTEDMDPITGFRIWTMRKDYGAMPNTTTTTVAIGYTMGKILSSLGSYSLTSARGTDTFNVNNPLSRHYSNLINMVMITTANLSPYSAYIDLYFTIEV